MITSPTPLVNCLTTCALFISTHTWVECSTNNIEMFKGLDLQKNTLRKLIIESNKHISLLQLHVLTLIRVAWRKFNSCWKHPNEE